MSAIESRKSLEFHKDQIKSVRVDAIGGQTAQTVCFLISAEASYITGQAILVDGGLVGSIQAHIPGRPVSKLG